MNGAVPFDPNTVNVEIKGAKYIDSYSLSPSNKLVPSYTTMGGGLTNNLVQA